MKRKYSIEERRSKILNMLHTEGRVQVAQLVETFGVSEVSIRKDLAILIYQSGISTMVPR